MNTIWKYPLAKQTETVDVCVVRPVHVGPDPSGRACIWMEVDPEVAPTSCTTRVVCTGEPIPEHYGQHAGSFIEGSFVWHVYVAICAVEVTL